MRAVVQRVARAQVTVGDQVVGRIETGLCVFVGVARGDSAEDARALADKVVGLRIFEDDRGKLNESLLQKGFGLLAVSQFTLLGDVRHGKRPSFTQAEEPEAAERLLERFCAACREQGVRVEQGRFRSEMAVEMVNMGPVTILLDTRKSF